MTVLLDKLSLVCRGISLSREYRGMIAVCFDDVCGFPSRLEHAGNFSDQRLLVFDRDVTDRVRGSHDVEMVRLKRQAGQLSERRRRVASRAVVQERQRTVVTDDLASAFEEDLAAAAATEVKQPFTIRNSPPPEFPFAVRPERKHL